MVLPPARRRSRRGTRSLSGRRFGTLYAINAESGEERWQVPGTWAIPSVAVVDGVVFTGSEDGSLYAFDAATGTETWRAPLGAAASRAVSVADGAVFIGGDDGVLHAFDTTGQERWQFETSGGVLGTVAIVDGVVYQCTFDGEANALYAVDAATGKERWRFTAETGESVYLPVVDGDTLFVGSGDGNIYALNTADGTERWRFTTGDKVNASPTLAGGVLYAANQDRNLYAIDASSGDQLWSFPLEGGVDKGPTIYNGVAYVGTNFGTLYAIGETSDATTPVSASSTDDASGQNGAPAEFLWRTTGGEEPLTYVTGIGVDPDGNLWVADAGRNRFQIFAPDGTYLETWGEAGSGSGQFDFLRSDGEGITEIAFAADGSFYVADSQNARVQHFAADRTFLRAIGSFGSQDGQFVEPTGVDVDTAGNLYVIDDQRDVVQKFDGEGNFLLSFGGHGSAEGQLDFAGWGAIDPAGSLWIADPDNNRVQQFAPDGTFLRSITSEDLDGEMLDDPQIVAFDTEGRMFVSEGYLGHGVHVFDSEGQHLMTLTGDDMGGTKFGGVYGIALDG